MAMGKDNSMNLVELQLASDSIAGLLSKLENPGDIYEKEKRPASIDKNKETDETSQEQDVVDRTIMPSIQTDVARDKQEDQRSENGSEDFAHEASSDSSFLEYEKDDLCGPFDSLNLAHCYENVNLLFKRFRTDAKLEKTAEIAAWFDATANYCRQSEADLEEKEAACISDFLHLEASYHDLKSHLESKDLNAVQCMRQFYNKVLSLRPEMNPAYLERKKQQSRNVGFRFPTFEESQEEKRKREAERRNRLQKEMKSQMSLDSTAEEAQPEGPDEQTSEGEKKLGKKRPRALASEPTQENAASMIAQDLLSLISDQQNEIANLRSRADMSTKSTEAMKMALEFVRYERDCEDTEQAGGKVKKRPGALSDLGKEVLNDAVEQARMKCITELLFTNEGRAFLETIEGAEKMLEAHSRGQNVIEEIEQLKVQMEVLQEQVGAVGDRSDRENELRQAIADRKAEIVAQEEANRKAVEAAQQANSPSRKSRKGGRKTFARSDTTLNSLGEDDSLGTIVDETDQSTRVLEQLAGMPDVSWLLDQSRETQNQLDKITCGLEKGMTNVNVAKTKLLRALEEAIDTAVDEELERIRKEEEGIVDFGSGNKEIESASQLKEKIKEQRRRLEEEQAKTQQLEEQESEMKGRIRKLKKSQKEHELEAKNKSRALGTIIARKATQGFDGSSDGTPSSRRRSSARGLEIDKHKKLAAKSEIILEEPQLLDDNGEPLPSDIHEVRGQVRIVGREIETLQKKEAQLQALAEAALRRHNHAGESTSETAEKSSTIASQGVIDPKSPEDRQREGTPVTHSPSFQRPATGQSSDRGRPGTGQISDRGRPGTGQSSDQGEGSRASERLESDLSRKPNGEIQETPLTRESEAGQNTGTEAKGMSAREAASKFLPGDESDKEHEQGASSKEGHGPRDKHPHAVEGSHHTVVVDQREKQVKELLFFQSENERLQKQISGVETKIRAAKLKNSNPDQNVVHATPIIVKDATLPEENRQMRREVRNRQRELNDLRKKWRAESDKHKRGAYENNIPGQLEAALKLLLSAPPDASVVQAKVDEEAKKAEVEAKQRAQEEAERLAIEAEAKANEALQEELSRSSISSPLSRQSPEAAPDAPHESEKRQSSFTSRRSSAFQSGAQKLSLSVSARELGSMFSAAALKVKSPQAPPSMHTPPENLASPLSLTRMSQSSVMPMDTETMAPDVVRDSATVPPLPSHASTLQGQLHRGSRKSLYNQELSTGWNDSVQSPEPSENLAIMGQKSRMSVEATAASNDKRENSSIFSIGAVGQARRSSTLVQSVGQARSSRAMDQFDRVLKATGNTEDLNLAVVGQKEAAAEQQGVGLSILSKAAGMLAHRDVKIMHARPRNVANTSSPRPPNSLLSSVAADLGLESHSPKASAPSRAFHRSLSGHNVDAQHHEPLAHWGVVEHHPDPSSFKDALPEMARPVPSAAMGSAVAALKRRLSTSLPSSGWQKMDNPANNLPGIEESS